MLKAQTYSRHFVYNRRLDPSNPSALRRMPNSVSVWSGILNSPRRILATVLALVFAVEVVVMLVLPHLIPGSLGEFGTTFIDACLLTAICAPLLWLIIIGPLRRIALQEHQRSETIVANAGEAILTLDAQGTILSCNPAAAKLFGIEFEKLIGNSLSTLVVNWPSDLLSAASDLQLEARRSDGNLFPIHVSISQFPSDSQMLWIAILSDLTAAQKAEQERISMARQTEALRAQQMTTLAQLATGVAHEIRNPLTSIKMLIQLNQQKLSDQGLPTDELELVEREIRRMERSVSSLLDFARPESCEFKDFAIQETLRRACLLIEGRCRSQQVRLNVTSPDQPIWMHGDSAQIQQLLLNLFLNALDAMPTGGTLSVGVETQSPQELTPRKDDFAAHRAIVVSVADTGTGISEAILSNLFEPFFTTKPNGVGLGLGICKRIAESHGGLLTAANQASGGAVFRLTIPVARSGQTPAEADVARHTVGSSDCVAPTKTRS
jgi:PAS domain S-box-containing protein